MAIFWGMEWSRRTRREMDKDVSNLGNPRKGWALPLAAGLAPGVVLGLGLAQVLPGAREIRTEAEAPRAVTLSAPPQAKASGGGALAELLEGDGSGGIDRDRKLLAFVDGVKPGDFAERIEEAFARRRGSKGHDLVSKLYQRWTEIDPSAALRHAEGLTGRNRLIGLGIVLSAWAQREPYKVIAWIEEHGKEGETSSGIYAALRKIAETDPEEAIALAERRKGGGNRSSSVSGDNWHVNMGGLNASFLYSDWASRDPGAAAAKAASIPNAQERTNVFLAIARQWAELDPEAAWAWGSGLERAPERDRVLQSIVGGLVANDETDQAVAFLDSLPAGQARKSALGQIAMAMAKSDPEKGYEFVRSQARNSSEEQAYSSILREWARTDPERVFRIAHEEIDPGSVRNSAVQAVIDEAARRDPSLALDLLGKMDDGALRRNSSMLAHSLARSDVKTAIAWAEGLPDGSTKGSALSAIFSEWANEDPEQASAEALRIGNEEFRRQSLRNTLNLWGQNDAVEAMTWAVRNLRTEDQASLIPNSLLGTWARQDIEGAAEWVAALPDGELRSQSLRSFVSAYASHDLVAAGEWLKRIGPGEARDQAVRQYASAVFDTDPQAALAWAESIGKEGDRHSQIENLARQYLQYSPDKAKQWIAASTLPPDRKTALLERAQPKR